MCIFQLSHKSWVFLVCTFNENVCDEMFNLLKKCTYEKNISSSIYKLYFTISLKKIFWSEDEIYHKEIFFASVLNLFLKILTGKSYFVLWILLMNC